MALTEDCVPTILIVAGMHRSGTSSIAGLYTIMGADIGRSIMQPAGDNPKGFFENERIVFAHDQLLTGLGRSWDMDEPLPDHWLDSAEANSAIKSICGILEIEFSPKAPVWLVKDPRICVLLPLWSRIAERMQRRIKVVTVLRHPEEVADSLFAREAMPFDAAMRLGIHYWNELAQCAEWQNSTGVFYQRIMADKGKALDDLMTAAAGLFGKPSPALRAEAEEFLTDSLRRRKIEKARTEAGRLFEDLLGKAGSVLPWPRLSEFFRAISTLNSPQRGANELEDTTARNYANKLKFTVAKTNLELMETRIRYFERELELLDIAARRQGYLQYALSLTEGQRTEAENLRVVIESHKTEAEKRRYTAERRWLDAEKRNAESERRLAVAADTELARLEAEKALADAEVALATTKGALEHAQAELAAKTAARDELAQRLLDQEQARLETERWAMDSEARRREIDGRIKELEEQRKAIDDKRQSSEAKLAAVQGELFTLRQTNRAIADKLSALDLVIMRNAQYPFRASFKSFLWGSARMGYRALPLSNRQKQRLLSRYGARLARFMPGVALAGQSHGIENIQPISDMAEPDFSFPAVMHPDVTVIVPVYNQLGYTLRCLKSLSEHRASCTFEVIVMDDVSSDPTPDVLPRIGGLRYVRNEENLGFLKNCNKAAGLAKGEYLVFLNNDTVVLTGWLDNLLGTFREHGSVGLVGSKLIYPDGRLQEAGGIIWNDASGWNWGRLGDPEHPRYNYVRDADYVSGASIMLSRALFDEIGRFDERYAPAYYEDTDLAFAVRDKGLRVIYQPSSAVIHFEGVSSGTDVTKGIKRYQVVNKSKFFEKWQHVLAHHGTAEDGPDKAADRCWPRHVLIIDAVTPTPDQDSGSVDMMNLIRILIELGRRVHFIPQTNYAHFGRYSDDLQKLGVECVYFPPYRTLEHYLNENGHLFDTVFLCREPIAREAFPMVRQKLPSARIVFYTVDLHYLRTERQAELTRDAKVAAEAAELKASELKLIRDCDVSILLSEFERDLLVKDCPGASTAIVPLIRDIPGRAGGFGTRKDVVFIGSFNHPPNTDAVQWLVSEIWPRVRERNVGARLKICGSNMPDTIRALCSSAPDIDAVGYVADLGEIFNSCRLSIAPLRFGAGLKGKLATSFGYGVPCVTTSVAVEGMSPEGLEPCRLQGETPAELADLIARYYADEADWERASAAGIAYVTRHFSYEVIKDKVADILAGIDARPAKP